VQLNRIAVNAAFFINGFILGNWQARLPRIQEIYNADQGTISLVLLAEAIGAVVAMPFTGWIIMRNGSRRITLFSAFMYSAIIAFIPFMGSIPALFALYTLMGIITGVFDVAMNSQAVMVEQQYTRPIMTSFHAFFSIGMALGGWCAAFFASLQVDLAYHLLSVGGAAVIIAVWTSRYLIRDKPTIKPSSDQPLFRLPSAALIGIGVITLCCMLGEGAMANWSVNYMENIAKASVTLAPIAISAFATAMTLGRLFGDRVRALIGDQKLIVLGSAVATAGILITLIFPFPYSSIAYSIAGNAKGLPHGVGLAMVTTVGYSGFLFGPPIIGFLADWQSLRFSLGVVAGLFVIMTILGLRYNPSKS
jgi:predicted MFS family arabinose efflux permease